MGNGSLTKKRLRLGRVYVGPHPREIMGNGSLTKKRLRLVGSRRDTLRPKKGVTVRGLRSDGYRPLPARRLLPPRLPDDRGLGRMIESSARMGSGKWVTETEGEQNMVLLFAGGTAAHGVILPVVANRTFCPVEPARLLLESDDAIAVAGCPTLVASRNPRGGFRWITADTIQYWKK